MVWGNGVLGSCSSEHVFRNDGVVDAWAKAPVRGNFSFDLVWRDGFDDGDDEDDGDEDVWRSSFTS